MRIHGLLFLVFFVVNGVLTHVAALDPSDARRPETSAPTAGESSKIDDAAVYTRALKDRSKEARGPLLDRIFGPLSRGIEKLLRFIRLFRSRRPQKQPVKPTEAHGRPLVKPNADHTPDDEITKLLKLGTSPEKALETLHSRKDGIFKWFEYLANYRVNYYKDFPMNKAAQLLKYPIVKDEAALAETFARMMNRPALKRYAEPVQPLRFQNMLVANERLLLRDFQRIFLPSGGSIAALPKGDPVHRAYKAFTLEFADVRGPFKRKDLQSLYSKNDDAKAAILLAKIEQGHLQNLGKNKKSCKG
ncbi:unnamed protein product [Hyaloperonospora brassicae]|uniref:RxLR effector candidate protein n=1 Tax=Hyaloperonospora brassicae TaxID=162125 RepID=A0AAV0TIG9_HYABA|nr:unnamed protein product [Hyaloperonospora brassicae]